MQVLFGLDRKAFLADIRAPSVFRYSVVDVLHVVPVSDVVVINVTDVIVDTVDRVISTLVQSSLRNVPVENLLGLDYGFSPGLLVEYNITFAGQLVEG